jgi:CheY-like chemotaxis protein
MEADAQLRPILVIDDDPDVGFLMRHILKKSGVPNPVRSVNSARDAMAILDQLAADDPTGKSLPLFLLVDLKMPEISGFEFLSWIRQRPLLATVPRIVMTSSMDNKDAKLAYALGANGFLTKYPSPLVFAAITRFATHATATKATPTARFSTAEAI